VQEPAISSVEYAIEVQLNCHSHWQPVTHEIAFSCGFEDFRNELLRPVFLSLPIGEKARASSDFCHNELTALF
jgi:hypothetical protein